MKVDRNMKRLFSYIMFQVIWDGKKGDNKIGVGIASNDTYTIIVVQYENSKSEK